MEFEQGRYYWLLVQRWGEEEQIEYPRLRFERVEVAPWNWLAEPLTGPGSVEARNFVFTDEKGARVSFMEPEIKQSEVVD